MNVTMFPPIERSLTVDVEPEWAFRFFTEKIGDWWPLEGYSVFAMTGRGRPDEVRFEPGVGGRIYERLGEEEATWGVVTAWEPPNRIAFSWNTNADWPEDTQVELTFTAAGAGTRVDVRHTGFERLGPVAEPAHKGYSRGWGEVLGRFGEAVSG